MKRQVQLLAVDQLSNLGTFAEIAALTDEDTSEVARLAQALALENLPVGYVELTLRQRRLDLYLQGHYGLTQDR
jgi:adenylate cyclase class IV